METNKIKQLQMLGQSVWLDYIRRDMIESGELRSMIEDEGLLGMTSNPAIFEKAITGSRSYDQDMQNITFQEKDVKFVYEALILDDIRNAADVFRPVFERTKGLDGYVSLEVDPHFAHDASQTIDEGRRLWNSLNRPNVFIKVPATDEGLIAIQQLISDGINVNITLLFGLDRYRQVMEAYVAGLEDRLSRNLPIDHIASVASFFVSRMDSMVDPQLKKIIDQGGKKSEVANKMIGQVAIANARMAYQHFKEFFKSERFKILSDKGAKIQRLLWASTSTKNPSYSDVLYVDSLIGPDTVNTMPMETFRAFLDHGQPEVTIEDDIDIAQWILEQLQAFNISYSSLTGQLEKEAVEKFIEPFNKLLETLEKKIPVHH